MKKILVGIPVVLVLAAAGWRVYQKNKLQRGGPAPRARMGGTVAVLTQPIRRETIRDIRTFTGTLIPRAQFMVAPKIAGRLEKLLVNIGDEIERGRVVALLDSEEHAQQVEQARAELEVARANVTNCQTELELAARELARVRELRKARVASEAELDEAEARHRAAQVRYEVALAQTRQKEAALKAEEVRLSYTRITATWEDGSERRVVGERYVDEGAMLRANEPIVTVLDVATLLAVIPATERDYPNIQIGQPAIVVADAFPAKTFVGKVVRKAPLLKESSRTARVEVEVSNSERLLAPGMFVRVELEFAIRENTVVVPSSAIVRRNGREGVFLADPSEPRARFVEITKGIVSSDRTEILSPPLDGRLVTLGQHLLEDGVPILMQDDGSEKNTLIPEAASERAEGRKKGQSPR
ncbi:MAG: efflux RND transporter periplasmic adaptor subunit [Kiritimatiellae bacterium]|nr:efflux RND transporter periplasmic adaptor subunit [Kiritimatiellia bacterium]